MKYTNQTEVLELTQFLLAAAAEVAAARAARVARVARVVLVVLLLVLGAVGCVQLHTAYSSHVSLADQAHEHVAAYYKLVASASLALANTNTNATLYDLDAKEQEWAAHQNDTAMFKIEGDPQLRKAKERARRELLGLLKHPGAPHFQPKAWQAWQTKLQSLPSPSEEGFTKDLATHITRDFDPELPLHSGDVSVLSAVEDFMPYGKELWQALGIFEEALAIARANEDAAMIMEAGGRINAFWERRNAEWRPFNKDRNEKMSQVQAEWIAAQEAAAERTIEYQKHTEVLKHEVDMQRRQLTSRETQQQVAIAAQQERAGWTHEQKDKELKANARNIEKQLDAMLKVEDHRASAAERLKLADYRHKIQEMAQRQDELSKERMRLRAQGMMLLGAFVMGFLFNIEQCLSITPLPNMANIRWWHVGALIQGAVAGVVGYVLPPGVRIGVQYVLIAASAIVQAIISLVLLWLCQHNMGIGIVAGAGQPLLSGALFPLIGILSIFNVALGYLLGSAVGTVMLVTGGLHQQVVSSLSWARPGAIQRRVQRLWRESWWLKGTAVVCIAVFVCYSCITQTQ
jgi:hypothetical protein